MKTKLLTLAAVTAAVLFTGCASSQNSFAVKNQKKNHYQKQETQKKFLTGSEFNDFTEDQIKTMFTNFLVEETHYSRTRYPNSKHNWLLKDRSCFVGRNMKGNWNVYRYCFKYEKGQIIREDKSHVVGYVANKHILSGLQIMAKMDNVIDNFKLSYDPDSRLKTDDEIWTEKLDREQRAFEKVRKAKAAKKAEIENSPAFKKAKAEKAAKAAKEAAAKKAVRTSKELAAQKATAIKQLASSNNLTPVNLSCVKSASNWKALNNCMRSVND